MQSEGKEPISDKFMLMPEPLQCDSDFSWKTIITLLLLFYFIVIRYLLKEMNIINKCTITDLAGCGVHDPYLVSVRGDDGVVSLQGDGQGEEHAGRGGQMTDSVTQWNQNTVERQEDILEKRNKTKRS